MRRIIIRNELKNVEKKRLVILISKEVISMISYTGHRVNLKPNISYRYIEIENNLNVF